MKIYTYGIIDSNISLEESLTGLNGAPVNNIPYRDISMVISTIDENNVEMTNTHAIEHRKVIEILMKRFTLLPVKFRSIYNRDQAISIMENFYSDIRDNIDRLRNKEEFGIKVIWSGEKIKEQIIRDQCRNNPVLLEESESQGRRFIEEVFKDYVIDKEFREKADICAAIVDNFLGKHVTEKRLEKLKNNDLLLNAFYLVERGKEKDFKEAFEVLKLAPGNFRYICSGPYPPYNFIKWSDPEACKQSGEKVL